MEPNAWIIAPFGLLLAAMALGPVLRPATWARHYPKITAALAAITAGYYLLVLGAGGRLLEAAHEYIGFIALIGSLFIVAGGVHVNVNGPSDSLKNTLFLLFGALISNILGTTGASMLLIRPWIQMNRGRIEPRHIVFFIFMVSNVGGCLTPVGDPPLFLGYLEGVPFWWTAIHCWPMWAVANGFLLGLFYVLDTLDRRRGGPQAWPREPVSDAGWRLEGVGNLFWLVVILGAVFISHPRFLREGLMAVAAAASYFTTRKPVHRANDFNLHPVQEVAILFAGIFVTMVPALDWLETHAGGLGRPSPAVFYWSCGVLSSVLDNAPAYLGFLHAAIGLAASPETAAQSHKLLHPNGLAGQPTVAGLLAGGHFSGFVLAISLGAVFFGALTYIGNGPNFMVKAIAEQQGVRMPSFVGYIFKYSLPCVVPALLLVWLIWLR